MSTESVDLPERSAKSAAAFRTISEVADELDVAQHVLRFWEGKFPQVKPLKRGGGRRYYRPEDIETLKEIRTLLYRDGYTIKGAQKLLRQKRTKSTPAPTVRDEPDPVEPMVATPAEAQPAKPPRDLAEIVIELKAARAQLDVIINETD